MSDLTRQETHFAFGENWRDFSALIDPERIAQSDEGLAKLLSAAELQGKTAIDIGCGSGLPALSMLRAGAAHVTCVDIDPRSVETAQRVLADHAPADRWATEVRSVFDLAGSYDLVYSWGVLHHTGDMWRAIEQAASLVKPGGLFVIAIYGKSKLCGFWKVEKRFYARSPRWLQNIILGAYWAAFCAWFVAKGKNPARIIADYSVRGMDWVKDARDWLGGYPYESATPAEIETFVTAKDFALLRSRTIKPNLKSGCDEYVFRRSA